LSPAVRRRQIAGAEACLQLPVGQTGPLSDARLLGRQSPAPSPLLLDDRRERYPNIRIGRLSLRRRFQTIARARDRVRLGAHEASAGRAIGFSLSRRDSFAARSRAVWVPELTPLAFAAASADLVRPEINALSFSASAA
jgi:hypothetical protein